MPRKTDSVEKDILDLIFENEDYKEKLKEEISKLEEQEMLILKLYYEEDLELQEIGDVLDLSKSKVSQIREKILTKLQEKLGLD